jgi:hypothetical protein|tara:strand:- start:420 stop:1646 length:1227 start_codon:yes stop_codon:yes gene_type:complete
MIKEIYTIEDCLELLAGLTEGPKMKIESSDATIMYSVAKQVFGGTALTDRQFVLMQEKLQTYKQQFTSLDYNFDFAVNNLRSSLREIDRARWIRPVEVEDQIYIGVRFTFNKKLISAMEAISNIEERKLYDKVEKTHYFILNETNLYKVISELKNKSFEIDSELQRRYDILEMMNNNKNDYIPGIYGFKLKNLHTKAINYMISFIGEPNIDNLAMYKDRDNLFGIKHFDDTDLNISINKLTTLSQKIVKRTHDSILVDSAEHSFNRLAESLLELNRYPLLVCLNDITDIDNLQQVHSAFKNIFNDEDSCILYRKENNSLENKKFNQYIKDNNLNNLLAINSKIVYTNVNKMSKTLLKSSWRPQAAILMGSIRSTKIDAYLQELDLVIHYDTDISPFKKYGTAQVIEKI